MASLYKRATAEQQRMLKAIAGAVRNTQHAHGMPVDYRFARSVAKRAVGTLCSKPSTALAVMETLKQTLATSAEDGQEG